MKSYTDLEQSKKLADILPLETADMIYNAFNTAYVRYDSPIDKYHIPAWSLAALMNLMPSEFTEVGKFSTTTYKIDIRKYKFTDDVDVYQIAYHSIKFEVDGQYSFKDMINTGEKEDLIDAVFQMICLLKEYKKI